MATNKVQFANNMPVELCLKYSTGKLVSGNYGDQYYYSLSFSSDGAPGMYVDPECERKITSLRIQANEKFWICKRKGAGKGAMVTWDVWRGPEKGIMEGRIERTEEKPSQLERDMARSLDRLNHTPGFGYSNGHGELYVPRLVTLEEIDGSGAANPTLTAPHMEMTTNTAAIHSAPTALETGSGNSSSLQSTVRRQAKTQLEDALCTAIAACHAAQQYAREIGFGVTFTAEDIRCCANTILIGAQKRSAA